MKKITFNTILLLFTNIFVYSTHADSIRFQTISFTYNISGEELITIGTGVGSYEGFPEGDVVLGGIPYIIPSKIDNYWSARHSSGENPRYIDISINIFAVIEVHTLINNYWGQEGNSYAYIEFFGSNGAYHKIDLFGNDHIRDYNEAYWTNTINRNTTIEVFNNGKGQRLDKQLFKLPVEFSTQKLDKIRLSDNGGTEFQRIFLAGLTVGVKECVSGDFNDDGILSLEDIIGTLQFLSGLSDKD